MFSANSPLLGCLILFGGILLAGIIMYNSRNKEYQKAMKQYEEDMAAYEAAVANLSSAVAVKAREVLLYGVDEKTAAMLIAIVCDAIKGDPGALDFVSIKMR